MLAGEKCTRVRQGPEMHYVESECEYLLCAAGDFSHASGTCDTSCIPSTSTSLNSSECDYSERLTTSESLPAERGGGVQDYGDLSSISDQSNPKPGLMLTTEGGEIVGGQVQPQVSTTRSSELPAIVDPFNLTPPPRPSGLGQNESTTQPKQPISSFATNNNELGDAVEVSSMDVEAGSMHPSVADDDIGQPRGASAHLGPVQAQDTSEKMEYDSSGCSDDEDQLAMTTEPIAKPEGYRLVDCGQLLLLITQATVCALCRTGSLILLEDDSKRQGWCSRIALQCSNAMCARHEVPTWEDTSPKNGHYQEVNRASVLAMRAIGKGRSAAHKFASFMNLPPPVLGSRWSKHTEKLRDSISDVCESHMKKAATHVNHVGQQPAKDGVRDCAVSGDGSWLTRGMSSHHGFVSVISAETGQVRDRHVMCNACPECDKHKDDDKASIPYLEFITKHELDCPVNHEGSAASMEVQGVQTLFERSVENNSLRYTKYIGDGDSKTFTNLALQSPYGPDSPLEKAECVGHVQKRMGTPLPSLIDRHRGSTLSDGKPLSGRGRLTLARIDYMQALYGQAIRHNLGDVKAMQRGTMAILHHYKSPPDHFHCPPGKDSFCSWQRDIALGTKDHLPVKDPLAPAIVDIIKPVFDDLSKDTLLAACSSGHTQNPNEALHHVVWGLVPKEQFHSMQEVQLGVDMGIMLFNQGYHKTAKEIMPAAGIRFTSVATQGFQGVDNLRIRSAVRHCDPQVKESRKQRGYADRKRLDAFRKDEGTVYASDSFHEGVASKTRAPRTCRKCNRPMLGHPRGQCAP